MSTCSRNGTKYRRHWWNDNGVCDLCGQKSEWAIQQEQESLALSLKLLADKIETIVEKTDRVLESHSPQSHGLRRQFS